MQLFRIIRTGDFSSRLISVVLLLTLVSKAAPLVILGGSTSVVLELVLLALPLVGGLVAAVIIVPLRKRCILLQDAIDATQSPFVLYDAHDRLIFCNREFRRTVDLPDEVLEPGTPYRRIVEAVLRKVRTEVEFEAELERRIAAHGEASGKPFDRRYTGNRWLRETRTRIARGGKVVVAVDVTETYGLLDRLNAEVARFSALADRAPVGICHLDAAGRLAYVNATLLEMFGVDEAGAIAAAGGATAGGAVDALFAGLGAIPADSGAEVIIPVLDRHIMVRKAPIPTVGQDGPGGGHIYSLVDVTERKNLAIRMQQLVMQDALTGACNRMAFSDDVAKAVATATDATPAFLIAMDLDRFKPVNDRFGHAAGDDLLRQVAARIGAALPEGAKLYRIGGDEFCVLGSGFDRAAAASLADSLLRALLEPFRVLGHRVRIGVSIGVSAMPHDAATAEALVHFADLAMYRVKESGGNKVAWFDEVPAGEAASLEAAFVAALQDRGICA